VAVNAVKAVNVTKYDAGGSGDDYIPDGYIKSVEKVWLDNYTLTSVITLTNTSIAICTLPVNKKITDILISIETSASQTSGTISVGFTTDSAIDTLVGITNVTHNQTLTTISLLQGVLPSTANVAVGKHAGSQFVTTGTRVTIALKLNNWTMSTGTIKSIVRYT
jgi:hypothetical protein